MRSWIFFTDHRFCYLDIFLGVKGIFPCKTAIYTKGIYDCVSCYLLKSSFFFRIFCNFFCEKLLFKTSFLSKLWITQNSKHDVSVTAGTWAEDTAPGTITECLSSHAVYRRCMTAFSFFRPFTQLKKRTTINVPSRLFCVITPHWSQSPKARPYNGLHTIWSRREREQRFPPIFSLLDKNKRRLPF